MKRARGFTLIELAVCLAILGILAAILFPVTTRCGWGGSRASCQANLKQLGLALTQYTHDWSGRFPPVAVHGVASSPPPFARPYGWADAVQPYARSLEILQCPSDLASKARVIDATTPGFTDYWLNTSLDRRPLRLVPSPASTFLCGEGNDGRDGADARYNRNSVPMNWLHDAGSPLGRHVRRPSFLFVDGHVKSLAPEKIGPHHFDPLAAG